MIEPLRVMRDHVYGERSSDHNWAACQHNWIESETWLVRRYNALPRPLPEHESLPLPKTHRQAD